MLRVTEVDLLALRVAELVLLALRVGEVVGEEEGEKDVEAPLEKLLDGLVVAVRDALTEGLCELERLRLALSEADNVAVSEGDIEKEIYRREEG